MIYIQRALRKLCKSDNFYVQKNELINTTGLTKTQPTFYVGLDSHPRRISRILGRS